MISGPGLAVLLVQISQTALILFTSPASGLVVNCSSEDLDRIPVIPESTTELHLPRNHLSTVSPGHFDKLTHLRLLDLSGNPFHCGCNIQYFRLWLLRNRDVVTTQPTCSSPGSLAGRSIVSLRDAELSYCVKNPCSHFNLAAGFMLGILITLLAWTLHLARGLTFTLGISERHTGFDAESLRSLKPKHRASVRRLAQGNDDDDMERPLLNMEILPQIIDTLHRRHNIKIT